MNKTINILLVSAITLSMSSCLDVLDQNPRNIIPEEVVLSSSEGINMYLADLYGQLPMEDFSYFPNVGFNAGFAADNPLKSGFNSGVTIAHQTDESAHPSWYYLREETFDYWADGYKLIRSVNYLLHQLPGLNISSDFKTTLEGEASFIRAFAYFGLAKRYGGVPLINELQEYKGDMDALRIPRSTEKETWDFILLECDNAAEKLTDSPSDTRRANKWVALALKSRAALFAASVAKFTHEPYVTLSGPAVQQKLAGIDKEEADGYYQICIDVSKEIMESGHFQLHGADPSTKLDAVNNFKQMFENPNSVMGVVKEPMFLRGYVENTKLSHNYDVWFNTNQTPNGWAHPGRMNPSLDLVDAFEDYADNGVGASALVSTRVDGDEANYNGFNKNVTYNKFPLNTPSEIFKDKDARLAATLILPSDMWKGTKIVIQGGVIDQNGNAITSDGGKAEGKDGETYYTFGASVKSQYSGFLTDGSGNYTRSGFLLRKFLQENVNIQGELSKGYNDWIEFRYAEILLNFAEAIVEISVPQAADEALGATALNAVRKRAFHSDEIALTQDNVRKERFVEFAFENKRKWDLIRWRTYHKEYENRRLKALVPMVDLRENTPAYIFVRTYVPNVPGQTYNYLWYYKSIPGTGNNGAEQNP